MGIKQKNFMNSRTEYTVSYMGMEGVDLSTGGVIKNRKRYAYLENMYKDYNGDGDGITESIPGFRKIAALGKRIHSIYSHKGNDLREYIVVHAGTELYRFPLEERDSLGELSPIAQIENIKSHAYNSGNDIYILDGKNITRVGADGIANTISDYAYPAYIPTAFINGKEYEQRNLLTDKVNQIYTISKADDYSFGTLSLKYSITSVIEKTCAVVGTSRSIEEIIYVPSYAEINGEKYKVTEIADDAFKRNNVISEVYLSLYTLRIGCSAFFKCRSLKKVVCSEGTALIGENAFKECENLDNFYIGASMSRIDGDAFCDCTSLQSVNYASDQSLFSSIEGVSELEGININYNVPMNALKISIPVFGPITNIQSLKLDGQLASYSMEIDTNGKRHLIYDCANKNYINGKDFLICCDLNPSVPIKNSISGDFISAEGNSISGKDAIKGCRICESFDGHIFLSGNENLPNTVFYTSKNMSGRNDPTYFGVFNYFNDGTGAHPVKSLLTSGDSIAVFKEGDDGSGSIYYHTASNTDLDLVPKIYPTAYTHNGISALGDSISFFDDPIFISSLGVTALEKKNINLEKSIAVRSHNINPKLLTEDLSKITLAKWCGYLAVSAGSDIYLADSRSMFTHPSKNEEYEWYYLCGIGTYSNDNRVFRYASVAHEGFFVHSEVDAKVSFENVHEESITEDFEIFYTEENGKRYEVTPTEEYAGGIFSPASCIFGTANGNLLLFGTESGDICIFNNDKKGIAPEYIRQKEGFDIQKYSEEFSGKIHPYYYSFAGHAPRYVIRTVKDDCGIPHLTKSTVKHSAVIKIRSFGCGKIIFEAGTEKSGYKEITALPASLLNFEETDFANFAFFGADYLNIPLAEKEKGWVEKEYNFYTEEFGSPFGICNIAYRFFVKGKIKRG